jgi:hypothetical protein
MQREKDLFGATAMLDTAGQSVDETQQGMAQAENMGQALQKKGAASLAMSGLNAYGNYRTGRK